MITIACFGSQWIAGTREKIHGVDYLNKPRAYVVYNKEHGFLALPGKPEKVDMSKAFFSYELTESDVLDLYNKQLKREEMNQDAIILPEEPKIKVVS